MLNAAAVGYTDDSHPRGCLVVAEPLLADYREASRAAIRHRIQQAVDEGELTPATDVEAITGLYGAIVSGLSVSARDGATCDELRAVARAAMLAWPARPDATATVSRGASPTRSSRASR